MAKQALSPWQRKQEDMVSVREEKRLAVLKAGAAAFRERGFERTSLDDIAGKLGVTKPTLYYYISDKQDIVYACSSLANGELMALAKAQDPKRPGLDALTDFFRRYVEIIAGDFGYCLTMINENLLPAPRVKELRRSKRELNAVVVAMLERGIADGSIAKCDTRLISFALFGAFNWVARWHTESSPPTDRVADVFMSLFSNGIAAKRR
ncbi:MAG TPA: TetR/AcrR family transcriptional regulator [Rhizomicrobium sp.]|jgi:AcrR family transcriptional regulator